MANHFLFTKEYRDRNDVYAPCHWLAWRHARTTLYPGEQILHTKYFYIFLKGSKSGTLCRKQVNINQSETANLWLTNRNALPRPQSRSPSTFFRHFVKLYCDKFKVLNEKKRTLYLYDTHFILIIFDYSYWFYRTSLLLLRSIFQLSLVWDKFDPLFGDEKSKIEICVGNNISNKWPFENGINWMLTII